MDRGMFFLFLVNYGTTINATARHYSYANTAAQLLFRVPCGRENFQPLQSRASAAKMFRMHRRFIWPVALATIIVASACDEKPKPPPVNNNNTSANTGPTTQELLTGPRTRITLGSLPLSMRVPAKGWKIETLDSGTPVLRGPTPSGMGVIRFVAERPVKSEELDSIINYAKKDFASKKDPRNRIDVRSMSPNIKVMEQFSVNPPQTLMTTDEHGNETSKMASSVNWRIEFFVPRQSEYERYYVNFMNLTYDEYEMDKPLLNDIAESLTFEGTTEPAI
jgi:hypothetical protein